MVILLDAGLADLAVIPSLGHVVLALPAHLLHRLLSPILQKLRVVSHFRLLLAVEEGQVQEGHDPDDCALHCEGVPIFEDHQGVHDPDVDDESREEDQRYGAASLLGFVLYLDIAVELKQVDPRVVLIKHLCYRLELVVLGDLHGALS